VSSLFVRWTEAALRLGRGPTSGAMRPEWVAVLVLPVVLLLLPAAASAAPHDGGPKILLHAMAVAQKNVCARGALADCRDATATGAVGVPHFVYLLGVPGVGRTLGGVEVGLTYQDGEPDDLVDGAGLDIFSWTRCATLDFLSPAPRAWPGPAGGNLISFDPLLACQEGETAVLGFFYLAAYAPDALHLIARPQSGLAGVADCAGVVTTLEEADLGAVRFSLSGVEPGCNPCAEPCPPAPELAPARCEMTMSGTNFGRVTVDESSTSHGLTIRNTGQQRLTGRLSLDSPHFTLFGGAEFALEPYGVTGRTIVFRAREPGIHTAELIGGDGCPSFTLTGEGRLHFGCSFAPREATLSGIALGAAATRTYVLTNHGAEAIAGTVTAEPIGGPFQLLVEPEYSLGPGASKDYVVQFRSDVDGEFSFRLRAGTCGEARLNAITAGAVRPPECSVSGSIVDFGEVPIGWSDYRHPSITNIGGSAFLTDIRLEGAGFSLDEELPSRIAIGAGDSWPVRVAFEPPAPGNCEGWLHFGGPCPPIRLVGVGRGPGAGVLEPAALDFGVVPPGESAEQTFSVTNPGHERIQGSMATNRPEFGLVGATTYSLAPGESATFRVRFASATAGEFRGALDAGEGSGVLPLAAVADAPTPIRPTTWSALKSRFGGD
jgi:hypothetical protein